MRELSFQSYVIDKDSPAFVVAEIGINHNGNPAIAREMIDAAASAKADAVKFQVFSVERFICRESITGTYSHALTGKSLSYYELFKQVELRGEQLSDLVDYSRERGILFFATPFDPESLDLLDKLGVPLFKVASSDLNHHPFLSDMASRGKPIILSTGMSSIEEVDEALSVIKSSGDPDVAVLHCVSSYPPRVEEINLQAIQTLTNEFEIPVGYSDHSIGIHIPIAAVAMGAKIIEKHFTLDKNMFGPDHQLSANPKELAKMVQNIRDVEKAKGSGIKVPSSDEVEARRLFRRSIVTKTAIPKGTVLSEELLTFKRPGTGISPNEIERIIGRKSRIYMDPDHIVGEGDLL